MKKVKKSNLRNLVLLGPLLFASIIISSCDKLKDLEPKSFAEVFEGKIAGDWIVDTIKYTSFDVNDKQTSEIIIPSGKITFVKTDDSKGKDIRIAQGYMYNTYLQNGKTIKDTMAYSYDVNSKIEVAYFIIHTRGTDKTFIASPSAIYDIKEVSKNVFNIERKERLVSTVNGQFYGYLRSVFKMHK
ncbi:hypothetical protein A5893_10625 [Pedobacter psychrophilus]|uniref:DUF5004 domain-containing protein n=1 Tax=Pedobacter psychrophilus TaxID=1826909 RepID=A0A179DDK7_9SPHI|nr:hypothetical protein [Pedobacter psychrophilus]OAQ39116.1 hypothetical protein A5893_10625 [Pedobacter psychrophilus]